ncbi:MAG: cation diffusion facilitator family transporter [Thermoplasmata archaeon]|nr:cation diffusion facilitator family transporter [Thermoplasmata archaeon]MCI4357141.1 cation diffusion facilitator family transporter [Thermoplasmata archaeon]
MRPQVIIYATVALSAVLFVVNLDVALQGGSHAVLSQAIYTITDLVGGALILWGFVASQKPPTYDHPFGYGKERFFWSFTGSLVTFTIAGLLVIVDSVGQILDPAPVTHLPESLAVVGITLLFSLIGILVTLRELRRGKETLTNLLESAHQGLKTIFYQDVVSVFGSIVAFAGIAIVYVTHQTKIDGIAAFGMGILLVLTGLLLAAESRPLLVGKAVSPEQARTILQIVERDTRVRKVRGFQSMMLGPEDVLVALRVNFQDGLNTDQIESAIDQVSLALRQTFPAIRHLVIEPES